LLHDLKLSAWPERTGTWILPRSWDKPEDRLAIKLGFDLYGRIPSQMLAKVLVREITKTKGLLTKPASIAQAGTVRAGSSQ
jgi:hypothetical protein